MKPDRRMFLRGAAGVALAIPFLPSLFSGKEARAATGPKRFVALGTHHGGVWQQSMMPPDAWLTQKAMYGGHEVRSGAITLDVQNGRAQISPVLSADSAKLTSAIAAKMNVLRGLDVTFYLAHHRGGYLGNYADNDGNGTDGQGLKDKAIPTIDQVLAWSKTFYGELSTILERSIVAGDGGMSHGYSSPATQSGTVQSITPQNDSLAIFNKIFIPPNDPDKRPPIVDRVLEDYKRLRFSNKRLSAADKQRLDDHIERVDELQRKLNVTASCGSIMPPTSSSTGEYSSSFGVDPAAQKRFWQLMNDVIVAAFACDTCRIATLNIGETFSTFVGDWHQDVAHQADAAADKQAILAEAHQRVFEDVYLDLVTKLDTLQDPNGGSVLDACLVQWTQESGVVTHDPIEMTVVTAGGAGEFFATGKYCDYRNLNKPAHKAENGKLVGTHIGLVYNQWLGNVLQSMGLAPTEYQQGNSGGYGQMVMSTETWYAGYNKYGDGELAGLNDILPFLKA